MAVSSGEDGVQFLHNSSSNASTSSFSECAQEERYIHVKVLGKGAFGEAVLYSKTEDNSLVVWKEIKLAQANDKTRLNAQNEIDILSMLNHANIITYYNHFVDESALFIEMEYANDGTLYEKIVHREDKLFDEKDVVWYLFQILSAIDHIHDIGILHRNMKTLNIFMTKQTLLKLGDFGISKVLKNTDMAETTVSTLYYMSPELIRGQQYSTKSDMWAIGCMLYELLTLKHSFEASNPLSLVSRIVQKEIDKETIDPTYSAEIKSLVCELLSKDPEKRPLASQVLNNYPFMADVKEAMEKRVWALNASTRKARIASSTATENIVRVVTSKTSEVYYWGGGRLTPSKLEVFKHGNSALQVAAGSQHFAAVTVEKELFTWAHVQGGQALAGQLGHGDSALYKNPKKVERLQNVKAVSCGEEFTACITDDGDLYTFGSDYYGCLGCDNQEGDEVNTPILVEFFTGRPVAQVSCGECHIVALTKDNEVYSWGCGEFGRLGLGSEDNFSLPQKVIICGSKTIQSVCAGMDGTFFVTSDGKVLACGSNENNKLGFNTVTEGLENRQVKVIYDTERRKDIPVIVKPLNRYHIIAASAGKDHSAVIDDTGRLITFGDNKHGQLGVGDCKTRSGVNVIAGLLSSKRVLRAACGDGFTVIATKDNEIFSFGNVDSGRLGIPVDPILTHRKKMSVPTPKPMFGSLHFVSDVSCRHWHCIVNVEKVLKSKTIRSQHQDSLIFSRDSRISEASQDDSVFTNASYNTSDNAASEAASTCNDEEQEGLSMTDSGCNTNSGIKDSSMPPWLVAELESAEFIPLESREPPSPQILAPHPQNIPHVDHSTTNDHPDLVPSSTGLSASQNQKSLNASSISIGLPGSSHPLHGLPPSVPPLCLDGLSGSGDSMRLQMIRDRVRDEEIEALNERLMYLEAENKRLHQKVANQDSKIDLLERKITPILRRDKKMWQSLDTWEKECQVANSNHPITQSTSSALQKVRRKPSRTSSLVLYPSHKHRPTYDYESIVKKMLGKKHAVKPKSKPDRVKCSNQYAQTDHMVTEPTKKYMNQFTQTKPSELQENPVLYEQGDTHRPRHSYRIFTPASSRRVKYRNRYINIDNPLGGAKGTSVTAMSGETGSDEASEGNQSVPTHRVDAMYNETYPTTPLDIPHDTLHDTEHSIDPIDEGSGPSRMLEKQATTEPTTSHYRKKMPKFTQHKRKYDVKVKDSNLNIKASGRYRSKSDPLIQSVSYEI